MKMTHNASFHQALLYLLIRHVTHRYIKITDNESTEPIDAVNILPLTRFEPTTSTLHLQTPDIDATNCATETSPNSSSADIDDDQCSTRRILVPFSMHGIYFVRKGKPDGSKDTSERIIDTCYG